MTQPTRDTICAVATPPGVGGIAVIRVSGPNAFEICDKTLSHKHPTSFFTGHTLHRASVIDEDVTVDDVLISVFKGPRSYTGEDVVEISCHGGRIPVSRTMALLLRHGCRAANPGEFTQRAFFAGQMDLSQAEAICDLINAQTEESYRQARAQKNGALSKFAGRVRLKLLGVLARIEASIDFPEDVGELDFSVCSIEISEVLNDLTSILATAGKGILLREGAQVVLAGQTNAGKSSLMNAILRTDRAIVTPVPGTTRDTLEETIILAGVAVRLWDTAGLRATDDVVEAIGVGRSRSAIESADLVLMVVDSTVGLTDDDRVLFAELEPERMLLVWNKCDLCAGGDLSVSAKTGAGIEELEEVIAGRLLGRVGDAGDGGAVISHVHQRDSVQRTIGALNDAHQTIESGLPADFLSIDVRAALTAIGEVTGDSTNEDVISEIFSRFCIGK